MTAPTGPDRPTGAQGAGPQPGPRDRGPWADSQFWILQLVILALVLIRLAVTVAFHLDATSLVVEFSTLALFVIPVTYASLSYGLPGAAVTAAWVTALAIPRFLWSVGQHLPVVAWAELLQVVLLDGLAVLIGQRVSAEREARRLADAAREAHLRAEALYRELFDSNQSPILIVDADGYVIEANTSAVRVLGAGAAPGPEGRRPVRLLDLIGPDAAGRVLTRLLSVDRPGSAVPDPGELQPEPDQGVRPVAFEVGGRPALYRPNATVVGSPGADRRMQVIFEDVTAETRRHDLMEAYAGKVVLAQEEERRRIAQELHDGPLQALIHLCRQIDDLADVDRTLTVGPGGQRTVASLRATVEETVAEIRAIARGLRPSILDDLGLVASINQMVAEATDRQHFESTFGVTGPSRRLSPTVELSLYRIAQEAISNVERHAAARRLAIGLDFESGGLRLLVRDDGIGFDPAASPDGREQSLGLPGMTERAHLIGATFAVHSQLGEGTTVDVWVPGDAVGGR